MSRSKSKSDIPKRADGQIRQSQMISMYGPGAMVDLVDRAVVIGGLEHWSYGSDGYKRLDEPRLRRSLVPRLKALDPNLDLAAEGYFRLSPACDAREASPKVGVRALEFPRWFVCRGCRRLARAADAFETHKERYRHQCERNKWAHAVPVRFVATCKRGHLSDFPWIPFAHQEKVCDRPELYLREGATGDVARIRVECRNCGDWRPLSQAAVLPFPCGADRPRRRARGRHSGPAPGLRRHQLDLRRTLPRHLLPPPRPPPRPALASTRSASPSTASAPSSRAPTSPAAARSATSKPASSSTTQPSPPS